MVTNLFLHLALQVEGDGTVGYGRKVNSRTIV